MGVISIPRALSGQVFRYFDLVVGRVALAIAAIKLGRARYRLRNVMPRNVRLRRVTNAQVRRASIIGSVRPHN